MWDICCVLHYILGECVVKTICFKNVFTAGWMDVYPQTKCICPNSNFAILDWEENMAETLELQLQAAIQQIVPRGDDRNT